MSLLRLLNAAVPVVRLIVSWLEQRRISAEAKRMADAALKKEEARASKAINEVMVQPRADDDAARRMRDGTF